MTYLHFTPFKEGQDYGRYNVEITGAGLIVYSECCADTMSLDTARKVHEALGRWITDHTGD